VAVAIVFFTGVAIAASLTNPSVSSHFDAPVAWTTSIAIPATIPDNCQPERSEGSSFHWVLTQRYPFAIASLEPFMVASPK
jgi:hypothetical protein